jgi:hypothetical protein
MSLVRKKPRRFVVWEYVLIIVETKNDDFTVRSAYHLTKEIGLRKKGAALMLICLKICGREFGKLKEPMWLKLLCGKRVITYCPRRRCYVGGRLFKTLSARFVSWQLKL